MVELLDRLDLHDVTLVGNDTGGALVQLLAYDGSTRIGRIVLASCEAFDNFPARVTGKTLALTGKLPPALFGLFMRQMRLRPVRRLPIAFGWLTKRGDATTARWMKPVLQQREIRHDAVRMLRAIARQPNRGAHGVDSSESGVRHESIERGRLEPSRDLVHMRAEKPRSPPFSSVAHKSREFGGVRSMRSHAASSPT
ncbi:MAG TPA: alpha/beta hydrolase [Mycobacterium sp.]